MGVHDDYNMEVAAKPGLHESKKVSRNGTPGRARTYDLLIRSQTLYPTELRVHAGSGKTYLSHLQESRPLMLGHVHWHLLFHV